MYTSGEASFCVLPLAHLLTDMQKRRDSDWQQTLEAEVFTAQVCISHTSTLYWYQLCGISCYVDAAMNISMFIVITY